jgi:hypothetical protein
VEEFCDQTLPCRHFVRRCFTVPSDHASIRSRSFRGGSSRGGFKRQKEKQSQENEEAKNIEGPSRQTQSKARLALIHWKIRLRIVANGQGRGAVSVRPGTSISRFVFGVTPIGRLAFPGGQRPKRGTWRLPVSALLFFAAAALISATGGTHRVRGVMTTVCVLSPVESTSPPKLFELQFPSTPMPHLWQERLCNFHGQ